MALAYVTLVLKPSAAQQADLDQLLAQQQDASSPNYHRWLTPEQYAGRFGVSQTDINKIVAWLEQWHLTVKYVARGRSAIAFGGTAGQVEAAFAVEIHHYLVNGELHFANATNPSIPAAFQGVVSAIRGLHDFRMKPRHRLAAHPRDNFQGQNQLAPDDIAKIYDITPLYNSGINGSGQKLAVAGQVQLALSDIEQYRSWFNLPAKDPQVVLVPGSGTVESCNPNQPNSNACGDLGESDLDLELSGAVARNATILFVYSYDVMDAVYYAIDQNLAPVVTVSYGNCELQTLRSDADMYQTWGNQANATGITWFAASGDSGAADCVGGNDPATNNSLSVDLPAGVPQVTGVGGTEFNEGSGSYWNLVNSASHATALSYIPEVAWNDSNADGQPSASGGGASIYFTKPSWQRGTGVPSDGARDVPDVSVSASADHDGYVIYSAGNFGIAGGTSVGAPQYAGIATLLNQYLIANGFQANAGLGNMNPQLYALAPVTGVFHDITSGNNMVVPCQGTRGCNLPAIGYNAGVGYDQVTGIGTVDVYNLVMAWHNGSVVSRGTVSMTLTADASSLTFSGSTVLTAKVTSTNGGTATGTVSFLLGNSALGTATLAGSNGTALATLTLEGVELAAGANTITAQYNGDNSYDGATASTSITVTSSTNGPPTVTSKGIVNGASFSGAMAPGGIMSIFGGNLAPAAGSALGTPLPTLLAGTWVTINGIAAPLYYVSPTQLNVQIPYEVGAGPATLRIDNNGESVFANFSVSAAAPAIFAFDGGAPVPYTTAARGQEIVLYFTGGGGMSPAVTDGATPAAGTPLADLPKPVEPVSVTVGGAVAMIDFIGIPTWSVGVVQVNYTIPASAPLGAQPVVVSVGGATSAATTLTVTQ